MNEELKSTYISGPMRGRYQYNFGEFEHAAEKLRSEGRHVISPAERDLIDGLDPRELPDDHNWDIWPEGLAEFQIIVKRDIDDLMKCDYIYMLNGWEDSKGANAELALAKWAGKKIMYEEDEFYKIAFKEVQEPYGDDCVEMMNDFSPPWSFIDSLMPDDADDRKRIPLYSGVLKYFPNTLIAVARCSQDGNDQHHPDKDLHWDKTKSKDELDAMLRHVLDEDWEKVAWRALANCERKIEEGYCPL